jgi:hypothetical protein
MLVRNLRNSEMTEEIGHFSSANPHKMEQNAQREYSKEG